MACRKLVTRSQSLFTANGGSVQRSDVATKSETTFRPCPSGFALSKGGAKTQQCLPVPDSRFCSEDDEEEEETATEEEPPPLEPVTESPM